MKTLPLDSFCQTGSGGTPSRSKKSEYYDNGTIPWIKSGELARPVVDSAGEFITESGLSGSSAKYLKPGAILIAMYGATVGQVSRLGIAAATNQAICHIYPEKEVCDADYLYRVLQGTKSHLLAQRVGGGQPNISQTIIRDLQIPLPPLDEQKRIAGILDAADALRAKRRESLVQLDVLVQSTFLDMFGDPVVNPMGWKRTTLEDFSVKVTDGDHHTPKRTDSGIKLLSARNVLDGDIDLTNTDFVDTAEYERMIKRCHPEQGDVLISCSGSIGRVSRIRFDEPIVLVRSAALIKIDHSRAVTEFVEQLLRTPALKRAMFRSAKSSSQANLFQKPIKNLPVFVPPLDLQRRFATIVKSIEKQKSTQRAHLDELDTLFASLQSRAFQGDL